MSTMTLNAGFGRSASPSRAAAPAVRLTRRARLLLTLSLLVLAVTAAVLATGGASALAGTDRPAAAHEQVTVLPGQTLWEIAHRAAPGADPRDTVQAILDLNGLQTAQVQAGTALLLP